LGFIKELILFRKFFKRWHFPTRSATLGKWGERRAANYLNRHGMKKICSNFKTRAGEIDLIMAEADGTVVFVEVKTRSNEDFSDAENAITSTKQHRISAAAKYFAAKYQLQDRPMRFDVIIIVKSGKSETIRHYKGAFSLK
jgi:putative endonuclease